MGADGTGDGAACPDKQAGVESLSTASYKGSGPKAGKASGHSAVRAKQASLGAGGFTTRRPALWHPGWGIPLVILWRGWVTQGRAS